MDETKWNLTLKTKYSLKINLCTQSHLTRTSDVFVLMTNLNAKKVESESKIIVLN